jgi:hypothetical protein
VGGAADGNTVAARLSGSPGIGNSGTEFDSTHGCGTGGTGQSGTANGFMGGLYGGGGTGAATGSAASSGGIGGPGLLFLNWNVILTCDSSCP